MSTAIYIENLSKHYRLGTIGGHTLRGDVNRWMAKLLGRPDPSIRVDENGLNRTTDNEIWALRNINLTVNQGDILGVVGSNGAGKSTLLKILSRITAPSTGRVTIHGRVGSLLEVGTGFHMELTGRENIYLNGAILGMTRSEVTSKLDEIVAFADMQQFVDTPVKRYSSGMTVRLAFAVAAHLEPEILIVDEVLAVGDAEFQHRCIGKMQDVAGEGRTVLFVSHNLSAVSQLCTSGVLLADGEVRKTGDIQTVLEAYEANTLQSEHSRRKGDRNSRALFINGVSLVDNEGKVVNRISPNASARLLVDLQVNQSSRDFTSVLGLYDESGRKLASLNSASLGIEFGVESGRCRVECCIESLPLVTGRYYINVAVLNGKNLVDAISHALALTVDNDEFILPHSPEYGPLALEHSWRKLS